MNRKIICMLLIFIPLTAFTLGCAAAGRIIDYGSIKTDVAMSETVFLSPTDAPRNILVQVKNTSSNQQVTPIFESVLIQNIQSRGYQTVRSPSQATYILQVNIRYVGEWKDGMDFSGTVTGAAAGALTGLGLTGRGGNFGAHAATGSLIGAGIGFAADLLTRVKTEVIAVDYQITEQLAPEQDLTGQQTQKYETAIDNQDKGGMGTRSNPSGTKITSKEVVSAKPGVKIYTGGVAAKAMQVNLNSSEAAGILIETAAKQIAGIF